jgi:hypothetical protein
MSAETQKVGTDDDALGLAETRARVRGTNINEQTLLATDYLNHFNEIVMTLEMIPTMPELLDEAQAWRPKGYREHFGDSNVADKDPAIEVYEMVPDRYRWPFEETIGQMDRLVMKTLDRIAEELAGAEVERLRITTHTASRLLQRLMNHASAIIHGSETTMDQTEIDALMEG